MCSPIAMAVMGLAGTGMQVYSQYAQSEAHNKATKYNMDIMQHNADLANKKAADAISRGHFQESQVKARAKLLQAKQRSQFAASGVNVSSGSAFDIYQETAYLGNIDALQALANAEGEAEAYRAQATNFHLQKKLLRSQKTDPWIGMTATSLGGIFGVGHNYKMETGSNLWGNVGSGISSWFGSGGSSK